MGVIGKPHGVRGQVRVHCHGETPERLARHVLADAGGRSFVLEWAADGVAWISEIVNGAPRRITDRDAATRLTNTRLFLPRSALPEPEEDEFYLADLIGLAARDEHGKPLGSVAAVLDHGAGASLELTDGRLIPFTRACVPEVRIGHGYLVVNPPVEVDAREETEG